MTGWAQAALVGVLLLDLHLVSTSRVAALIRAFAVQSSLVALLALLLDGFDNPHAWAVAGGTLFLKTLLIPHFLRRAAVRTGSRREVEPSVSYGASILLMALAMGLSFGLAAKLPMEARRAGLLLAAAAFSTMLAGLLLLVSRSKALTEVVGYLVLENGIFLFGLTLLRRMPVLVEVGILLDVFVGASVMGIVIYNIHRTFDHIDVRALSALKEEEP